MQEYTKGLDDKYDLSLGSLLTLFRYNSNFEMSNFVNGLKNQMSAQSPLSDYIGDRIAESRGTRLDKILQMMATKNDFWENAWKAWNQTLTKTWLKNLKNKESPHEILILNDWWTVIHIISVLKGLCTGLLGVVFCHMGE